MNKSSEPILIQTTFSSIDDAKKIASTLLNSKLCACIQLIPNVTSLYIWKNTSHTENEVLMKIKTFSNKYHQIEEFLSEKHPYETPEIIASPLTNISPKYFKWLKENLA